MANEYGNPESPQNLPPETDRPHEPPSREPYVPAGREIDPKARMWAMFCHLAGFAWILPVVPAIGAFLGPLVVWLIKKDEYPFVDEQGKEAVNFQITMLIYTCISVILMFVCIGFVLVPLLIILHTIFLIVAAIKANDGKHYRYPYPLIIRFIK